MNLHKSCAGYSHLKIGQTIQSQSAVNLHDSTPAPGSYNITAEFDYKDPMNPDSLGKQPKFAFGSRYNIQESKHENPGPGQYETDVIPTY